MVKIFKIPIALLWFFTFVHAAGANESHPEGFPFILPKEKPDRALSAAMQRSFQNYPAPLPEDNELYSQFKYTPLKGFDYHNGDGAISRRDPTKILFENGKYYVWYTKRDTLTPPKGAEQCTDEIPSTDWDLAEIWYATSEDGFTWAEQGAAVPRPAKPHPGWRSVSTPGILKFQGKFYLYYQAFIEPSMTRGDYCSVSASYADSPDGPWTAIHKEIISTGPEGSWDQYAVHDPYPLVHNGKIYIYYKSVFNRPSAKWIAQGLTIADQPLGPFEKHPLNPILNSGHETTLFPFKEGVASLTIRDGQEHFTVQYAKDWVNFKIASITELMPTAAGPFIPDAFKDTGQGRGITWGLSHFINAARDWQRLYSILTRFDCDLSLDIHDPEMKKNCYYHPPEYYYKYGLSKRQRQRIQEENHKQMLRAHSRMSPVLNAPGDADSWVLDERFSDEFNGRAVDEEKWEKNMKPWGERAWSSENVYLRNGSLVIRAHYEPHQTRGRRYFYKLGILRSRQKTTYGFFEARIKGCSRFPGLCPAFWLYSYGKDRNPDYPKVAYSEIDIVEMLQGLFNPELKKRVGVQHLDLNLHTRLLDENGEEKWVRPNQHPELCRNYWSAPWDPRNDYHIYACENSPDKILWYIDGVKVAEKKNLYWHLPMSVTFTMELRPPLIAWAGEEGRIPVPEASTPDGFPTEMEVDYVRCWRKME